MQTAVCQYCNKTDTLTFIDVDPDNKIQPWEPWEIEKNVCCHGDLKNNSSSKY